MEDVKNSILSLFEDKPEVELRQLAIDMAAGRVFTDRHVRKGDQGLLGSIFMPLVLMSDEQRTAIGASNVGMFYEHLSEAAPRCINGYPIFLSMRMLSQHDTKLVIKWHDEIIKQNREFLAQAEQS